MRCPKCGNLLPSDSEFCQYCGIKIMQPADVPVSSPMPATSAESCSPVEKNSNTTEAYYFENMNEFLLYAAKHTKGKDVDWLSGDNYVQEYNKGVFLFEAGRYDHAIQVFQRALKLNPIGLRARFEICEAYLALGETAQAQSTLLQMTDFFYDNTQIARFYRRLGYIKAEEKQYDIAAACYRYSVKFEKHASVKKELKYIESKAGRRASGIDPESVLRIAGLPILTGENSDSPRGPQLVDNKTNLPLSSSAKETASVPAGAPVVSAIITEQPKAENKSTDLKIGQNNYTVLDNTSPQMIQENSPIIIERTAILKENSSGHVTARAAYRSLSTVPVHALMVDIACTGTWGESLESVSRFEYIDLNEKENSVFGWDQVIDLPDQKTRFIDVRVRKVLLNDRNIIEPGDRFSVFPKLQPLTDYFGASPAAEQFVRETNGYAQYVPVSGDTHWRCACGQINSNEEANCRQCHGDRERWLSLLTDPELVVRANDYLAEIEEQKRLEVQRREEQERKERELQENQRQEQERKNRELQEFNRKVMEAGIRKQKKKRRIIIALIVSLLLIGISIGGVFYVPAYLKYNEANQLLEAGQYDTARQAFLEIAGFKDSSEMVSECQYQKACNYLGKNNCEVALPIFEDIKDYKDSAEKILLAKYIYVKKHYNNDDTKTYQYLLELKEIKYSNSASFYKDLYDWKVIIVGWNSSEESTTYQNSISIYKPVYCHIELCGGTPGAQTVISYKGSLPSGYFFENSFDGATKDQYSGYIGWSNGIYKNPDYGATGTLSIRFYDSDNNLIGQGSIKITE